MKSGLNIIRFLQKAIEDSGKQIFFCGEPLTPSEVVAPNGALPILLQQAQVTAWFLDRDGTEENWLKGFGSKSDESSLFGVCVNFPEALSSMAQYPVVSLFYDALGVAAKMSDNPDQVELSHIFIPVQPEVIYAMSLDERKTDETRLNVEVPQL